MVILLSLLMTLAGEGNSRHLFGYECMMRSRETMNNFDETPEKTTLTRTAMYYIMMYYALDVAQPTKD